VTDTLFVLTPTGQLLDTCCPVRALIRGASVSAPWLSDLADAEALTRLMTQSGLDNTKEHSGKHTNGEFGQRQLSSPYTRTEFDVLKATGRRLGRQLHGMKALYMPGTSSQPIGSTDTESVINLIRDSSTTKMPRIS
jgi:hypothetical protein